MTHITPHRLTGDQARASSDVRRLYELSFPEAERIEWERLCGQIDTFPLDATAWRDPSGALCAITIVLPQPDVNWFWYFAVEPGMRGNGLGTRILHAVMQQYLGGKPLILDMEHPGQPDAPNTAERRRRRDFYARNGWRDTDVCANYWGITYTVMMTGSGTFGNTDYHNLVTRLWGDQLPARDND